MHFKSNAMWGFCPVSWWNVIKYMFLTLLKLCYWFSFAFCSLKNQTLLLVVENFLDCLESCNLQGKQLLQMIARGWSRSQNTGEFDSSLILYIWLVSKFKQLSRAEIKLSWWFKFCARLLNLKMRLASDSRLVVNWINPSLK